MAAAQATVHRKKFQDLTGQRFGKLTVVSEGPRNSFGHIQWNCVCDCGEPRIVTGVRLTSREATQCKRHLREDLTGVVYGTMRVIGFDRRHGKHYLWKVKCDLCGIERIMRADYFRLASNRQCSGCRTKNGLSRQREHNIWARMIDRCHNERARNYRWYGAFGKYVCKRWRESYAAFIQDMGAAPSLAHTLDRINTFGSYTCGQCDECREKQQTANCRWATKEVQVRNCKNNLWFTHDGKTMILKDWARHFGVSYLTVWHRIFRSGMPFHLAILNPSEQANTHGE